MMMSQIVSNTKPKPQLSKETFVGGSLKAFREDPLLFMNELYRKHGDYARFRLGPQKFYAIFNPDMLKEVMITKADAFSKAGTFDEIKRLTGEGLVTSDGAHHDRQRRIMQPKFTRGHIQKYAGQMGQSTRSLIAGWNDGQQRDLTHDLFTITFDIMTRTLFSYEAGTRLEQIEKAFDSISRIATEKIRTLIRLPLLIPTKQNREYTAALCSLDDIVFGIIADRRAMGGEERQDLLSVLMEAVDESDQTGMTDRQLRDELLTMFLAGHETTAHTLAWAFDFLMRRPDVEEKLVEEWSRVLGGELPTADHFNDLVYTQNVIWETLRMRPAGYLTGRTAIQDTSLGNLPIRRGEALMISPYPLHMHPGYFDEPETFRPERFENDYVKTLPIMAYFPFGAGPRSCIGNHFAMLEMVIILAAIGQTFRLRPTPNHLPAVPEALLTLTPKGGIRVTVERR
ncbi:cytochrome P450 [Paenibacillus andongensis]|uniref:cytochrome P450 n=1 Tax=Paenibacillus andongensis TaxID=2975482 RepID=UPI0021BAF601|nr:cytochrome P450 [Paenibacillus andongensis]